MKYYYSVFVIFVLLLQNSQIAQAQAGFDDQIEKFGQDLTGKIVETGKKRIAVAAFSEIDGTVTQFGNFLTDELSAQLSISSENQTKFEVIERANLEQIFAEHKLAMSGIVDGTTAKELGKIKAADAIVVGTVTPMGETYRVTIKVLDTEAGNIVTSSKGQIVKTPSLQVLQDKIVRSPKGTTQPKPTPPAVVENAPKIQIADVKNSKSFIVDEYHPVEEPKPTAVKSTEQLGTLCFIHNANGYSVRDLDIRLTHKQTGKSYSASIRTQGGTTCFYELPYGVYKLIATTNQSIGGVGVIMETDYKLSKAEDTISVK